MRQYLANKLKPEIRQLVELKEISWANAWALTQVPLNDQWRFIECAKILSNKDLKRVIREFV